MWNRKTSGKRHTASLAVVFALLFQASLTSFALPAHAFDRDALAEGPFPSVVICTAQGLVRMQLDAEGNPIEESRTTELGFACTVCCALACGCKAGLAASAWPVADLRDGKLVPQRSAERAEDRGPLNRQSRDPPLPA